MNTKRFLVCLTISLVILSVCTLGFCEALDNFDNFKGNTSPTRTTIENKANDVIGIVQVVAVAAAVIMLIYLGIKYISAAPSEKADIKKSAVIYVVGASLLLATTGILQLIKTFAQGVTNM